MDPTTYRGLALLLSLGTLPVACKTDETSTDSDGGTGGGTTTGTPTGTGPTDGSGSGTGGSETDGSGSGTGGTTTGGGDGSCETYVGWSVMCDPSLAGMEAELQMSCEAARKMYGGILGPTCVALYDDYLECESMAPCDDTSACEPVLDSFYACGPDPGEACKAFGMKYAECGMGGAEESSQYCQVTINSGSYQVGAACGTAYEELYACLSALSCADFETGTGCEAEEMAAETAC